MSKPNKNRPKKPEHRSRAAEEIHKRIQGLVRSLLQLRGSEAIDGLPDEIEVNLRFPIHLSQNIHKNSRAFARSLVQQVEALRVEGETELYGHRSGHAHCYWCHQPSCEHSTPEDGHSIFSGWSPTGIPIWKNITTFLLSEEPELLDHLHGDQLKPMAVVVSGAALLGDVLQEYIEGTTFAHPVGCLLAGGFPLLRGDREMDHLAITAMLLETMTARGIPKYRWNFISTPPAPLHLPTMLGQEENTPLARWISAIRSMLIGAQEAIESRAREGKRMPLKESRKLVLAVMNEAQSLLGTLQRRHDRRTRHADMRVADPDRPTSAASTDVLASKRGDTLVDRRESTIIVRGPHGRIHVFTRNGIHVTSVRYSPEAILNRIQRRRWTPIEDHDFMTFKEEIMRRWNAPGSAQDKEETS